MSIGPDDAVEIYRARDLPEAHALTLALESEGIAACIDNEMLQAAVGGLLAGWPTAPRVLVAPTDTAAARVVLDRFLQRAGNESAGNDTSTRCLACGTPMGEADACAACGWSYRLKSDALCETEMDSPIDPVTIKDESGAAGLAPEDSPQGEPEATTIPPTRTIGAIWAEVGAVLAVGVIPNVVSSALFFARPRSASPPYWVAAVELAALSACTIYVTIYIVHQSGESWKRFGLTRPTLWDLLLGIGMFFLADMLTLLYHRVLPWDGQPSSGDQFPLPQRPLDYVLMVLQMGTSGFAEELVTRAYLVTRLQQLLRSPVGAVLVSAALFSSYHSYQGAASVASCMVFGIVFGAVFVLIRRVWPLAIGHMLYNIKLELPV